MTWLPIAVATAVAFGLYNVFIKTSAGRIDQVLGAAFLQVIAALLGVGYAAAVRLGGRELPSTAAGWAHAGMAGLAVGVAEILTFVVFARGAPASVATPIIMGGSVVVVAIIGALLLREPVGVREIAGVVLVVAGIALLSSGAKAH